MSRSSPEALERFTADILRSADVPSSTAQKVASSLVRSDLRGHASHGCRRAPQYVEMINADRIDPMATPVIDHENRLTTTLDGQSAFGQIVGREAIDRLIEKAEEAGIGVVGMRDATHLGRIGEWGERVAEAGFVFMAFVNGQSDGSVAPPGSSSRRLFTNPITFAMPSYSALKHPILLDMATSQVANGKVRERMTSNSELPDGWAIGPDGGPMRDPKALLSGTGALLPLGGRTSGYKGFGLGIIAELFAGNLSDGRVANQSEKRYSNAGVFLALDPLQFTTEAQIEDRIRALEEHVRSAEYPDNLSVGPGAKGDRALLPGEAEHQLTRERRQEGVPISEDDVEMFREFATKHGIDSLPDGW